MKIGFDAKRAFQNNTGLGHYSRTLISSLAHDFPQNDYVLFAPKITGKFQYKTAGNISTVFPKAFPFTILRSAWRSFRIAALAKENALHIYHGLSQELPVGIERSGAKTVVTIHDLIFERYPHQYNPLDLRIYRKKFKHACKVADQVIAISEQTKADLVHYYKVPAAKIEVCYQSCNPTFFTRITEEDKNDIRKLYKLPRRFFLSVGSVIERKNLLTVCRAMLALQNKLSVPLLVIGNGDAYMQKVKAFIRANGLEQQVIFLAENVAAQTSESFNHSADLPAIYQMAEAMIYPSIFEGFGIPVLEALASRCPVITSNVSCLPEAGGAAAAYIDPYDAAGLAKKMFEIATHKSVAEAMKEKGWMHAQAFTPQKAAAAVMNVYQKLLP